MSNLCRKSGPPAIRRAWEFLVKLVVQGLAKPLLVKILVVLATTQLGTVKSEAEEGSS